MRILVTGSVAFDFSFRYDGSFVDGINVQDLQNLSIAYRVPEGGKCHGGTGANVAWSLAKLGAAPTLISTVGKDGAEYRELLERGGVDVRHVRTDDKHLTATAFIATDKEDHQITFFHPGADESRIWPDLDSDKKDIAYALIGPSPTSLSLEAISWCTDRGIPSLFDPGQQVFSLQTDELWRAMNLCTGMTVNSYEWSILEKRLQVTPQQLIQETIFAEEFAEEMSYVIITHADEGFTVYEPGRTQSFPACRAATVVNPSPAGDCFRAGILAGLTRNWSLTESAQFGAALASSIVEREDAIVDAIDVDALYARVKATYGTTLPSL